MACPHFRNDAIKILRDQRGQAAILMAVCLLCLCGLAGLAVDTGAMFRAKRILQTAADAAAISGADEFNYGGAVTAAKAASAQNDLTDGVSGTSVTVNAPPLAGPNAGQSGYVEVIVSQPQPTYFMKLFHWNSMTVSARAVAAVVPTRNCVATLGTASPGVSVTGGAILSLPGCSISDNATGSNAFYVTGGAAVSATSIGVVGGTLLKIGAVVNPTPVTGIDPLSDPLASFATPPPASSYSSGCVPDPVIKSSRSIWPGCYNGLSFPKGSPTVTVNPGVYIIKGPNPLAVASGTILNGTDVTFYFVNGGSFNISNGAMINLSAPTAGTNRGLLFYQDPSDTAADFFVGGSAATLNGIFYLPSASLTLANGNATLNTDLVVGSLSLSGSATLHPYIPVNGTSPLATIALVE